MALQSSEYKVDDVVVIALEEGKISHENAAALKELLFLQIADGNNHIVLDMSAVQEIDSSGLGALLFGKRQANNQGGDMVLVGVAESIQSMIRIAQLSRVFEIFDNLQEAIDSLKSAG